jgi:stearoyl-CoA desaturase (delta-9 desaturase)
MLILDLALFGAIGLTVWAVQMAVDPVMAAGIINGIGHYWGYRNFEAPTRRPTCRPGASSSAAKSCTTTTTPTRPRPSCRSSPTSSTSAGSTSALMEIWAGQGAQDRRRKLKLGDIKPVADGKTLEALIANRYEVMASYARELKRAVRAELEPA